MPPTPSQPDDALPPVASGEESGAPPADVHRFRTPRAERVAERRAAWLVLAASLVFAAVFWVADAAADAYGFHQGTFAERLVPADATELWLRGLVGGLLVSLAAVARFVIVELRRGEQGRREVDRLRGVERLKTEFINTAAHELNTPLTPIKIQLHLLRGAVREAHDEQRHAYDVLARNFDRMAHLVQGILEGARLQSGRLRVRCVRADLSRVVRDAVEAYRDAARVGGVDLTLHAPPELPATADPHRMGQVVANLVSNALKYTPPGGWVRVDVKRRDGAALVSVRDSGRGLSADQIPRLFSPFSQVHTEPGAQRDGSGLGLYICRGIVEQHGGRIWAESAGRGLGSAFLVAVPLAEPFAPAAGTRGAPVGADWWTRP